jgi:hypothetical protein
MFSMSFNGELFPISSIEIVLFSSILAPSIPTKTSHSSSSEKYEID